MGRPEGTVKRNILCVDDEQMNLNLLDMALIKEGYAVLTTDNGLDALDLLITEKIDLVIADVMMSRINGFDICRRIKQDSRLKNIPVILIMGMKSTSCLSACAKVGADDFLVKPLNGADITARVGILMKLRLLNERIESAERCISTLNLFGQELLDNVRQRQIDFLSSAHTIAGMLVSWENGVSEKPKTILIGVLTGERTYEWYQYSCRSCSMKKTLLALDISWKLQMPEPGSSRSLLVQAGETETSELAPLLEELRHAGITVSNGAGYLDHEIGVVALNYDRTVDNFDAAVLRGLAMQVLSLRSAAEKIREQEDAFFQSLRVLAQAADPDAAGSANYADRIAETSVCLSRTLGMHETFVRDMRVYAPLYDVGKVSVPMHIMRKQEGLTEDEVLEIQRHTLYGAKILGDHKRFTVAKRLALTHHERWDGTGYPNGLKGEEIPIEGRILNIVGQYEALRTRRPYRPAFSHEDALAILSEGDGRTVPRHFDPRVLAAFREAAVDFKVIYSKYDA